MQGRFTWCYPTRKRLGAALANVVRPPFGEQTQGDERSGVHARSVPAAPLSTLVQACTIVRMDGMPSSEFRRRYASLSEPVIVTVNGHAIGVYQPISTAARLRAR